MKVFNEMRKSKYYIPALSILIAAACCIFFYKHFPIFYDINDDTTMRNIASGAYTGEPDGHVVFIKYALGCVISGLYGLISSIDWYGTVLFSLHFICLMFVICRVMKALREKSKLLLCLSGVIIFIMIDISNIVSNFQFTTTAAVCGATALFLFISMPKGQQSKDFVLSCLPIGFLVTVSFCIRDKVLLMMVPAAIVVWIYRMIEEKDTKGAVRRYIVFCFSVMAALLAVVLVERAAYSSEEWKDYRKFNSARSEILDYYGYPDYETHQEAYDKIGISKEEYDLLINNTLNFSSELTMQKYIELAVYSKAVYEKANPITERLGESVKNTIYYTMNIMASGKTSIVLIIYFFLLLFGLIHKRYKMVLSLIIIFVCREAVYLYPIMLNRFLPRIYDSLLLCDYAVAAGYLLHSGVLHKLALPKNKISSMTVAVILGMIGVSTYLSYYDYRNAGGEDVDGIVNEYCTKNKLNGRYLLDSSGFTVGRDNFVFRSESPYINYLTMYGWSCNSELYLEKAEKMNMKERDSALLDEDVFLIATSVPNESGLVNAIINYYDSIGVSVDYEVVDTIPLSETEYSVLKFYSK